MTPVGSADWHTALAVVVLVATVGARIHRFIAGVAGLTEESPVLQFLPLFLMVYADLKPLVAELGGAKGVVADAMGIYGAVKDGHKAVVAARAATSDGGSKITLAEAEPIAVAFCGHVAETIATNAGVTDQASGLAFAEKIGAVLFPKVFAHLSAVASS